MRTRRRDRASDGGGRHAVSLAQRLHDAPVREEELGDAHVIVFYGDHDGGAAETTDDSGIAAPVSEKEVDYLKVFIIDSVVEGVAVIVNIGSMIALQSEEVLDDGEVVIVDGAGNTDGVSAVLVSMSRMNQPP